MKNITSAMTEHLQKGVTTLSTCWEIKRRDGVVLRFTDFDEDIVVDGETYLTGGAYSRTAIESTTGLAVDNLDVEGITSELSLPAHDLRIGLFDHAQVYVFATPWMQAYEGTLPMRRGFFGEVQVQPNGSFKVEMRGLMQRFSHTFTDVYSPTCRHEFGDTRCGVPVIGPVIETGKAYSLNHNVLAFDQDRPNGARYDVPIGDPGFEDITEFGTDQARYWYDRDSVGATDLADTSLAHTGTGSGRASTTSGAVLTQDVALLDGEIITEDTIDAGDCTFNLRAFRRDDGGTGRLSFQFLNWNRQSLRAGKTANLLSAQLDANLVPEESYNDFTVETWITGVSANESLLANGRAGARQHLYFRNGSIAFASEDEGDTLGTNGTRTFETPQITAPLSAEWTHIAISRIGEVTYFYVNGTLIHTHTGWITPLRIDRLWHDYNGNQLHARLDEFRIWDIGRVGGEIRHFMGTDLPSGTENLVHYFPFEDGTANEGSSATNQFFVSEVAIESPNPISNIYYGELLEYDDGHQDAGTDFIEYSVLGVPLPRAARMIRIMFEGNGVAPEQTRIDNLRGFVLDHSKPGTELLALSRVLWQCTTAGVAVDPDGLLVSINSPIVGDEFPPAPLPGEPELPVGTAIFTAREAIFRTARVTQADNRRTFTITLDWEDAEAVSGWYDGGLVTFHSGKNKGASMEVKSWTSEGQTVELFLSMSEDIDIGDQLTIYPGCDKSRICCSVLWDNIKEFFGTPDVPGEDALFRYPDANQ